MISTSNSSSRASFALGGLLVLMTMAFATCVRRDGGLGARVVDQHQLGVVHRLRGGGMTERDRKRAEKFNSRRDVSCAIDCHLVEERVGTRAALWWQTLKSLLLCLLFSALCCGVHIARECGGASHNMARL